MIVDSGILKERTTEDKIKELLPCQITDKYFVHQIHTWINHMRKSIYAVILHLCLHLLSWQ